MSALRIANAANVVQRHWCAELLARAPARLHEPVASAISWLEAHPDRTLAAHEREMLQRFDAFLPRERAQPVGGPQLSLFEKSR